MCICEAGDILNIFLRFWDFETQFSYKNFNYNKSVHYRHTTTVVVLIFSLPSVIIIVFGKYSPEDQGNYDLRVLFKKPF